MEVILTDTTTIETNHALLGANSRLLKSDAEVMRSNHDLLLAIAARGGVAA